MSLTAAAHCFHGGCGVALDLSAQGREFGLHREQDQQDPVAFDQDATLGEGLHELRAQHQEGQHPAPEVLSASPGAVMIRSVAMSQDRTRRAAPATTSTATSAT